MKNKKGAKRTPRKTPKYIICLKYFLANQADGLNELDALRLYGETCLHSTVSTLSNNHGISFKRKFEPHRHQGGGRTHFMRYWLDDVGRALKLTSGYKKGGE